MVEGPGVHRAAVAHRKLLLGQKFKATSPNGRFTEGAAAITGRCLTRIEAHGKNLFYFFRGDGGSEDVIVVHIHFGMSGRFSTHKPPGPKPRQTTRLQLENKNVLAHLSAMHCIFGSSMLYEMKVAKLGPDPLRNDADKELVWQQLQKSKRSIGAMLMDQSVIAGIGNIYRAEVLFLARTHPDLPSQQVSREAFEKIWSESVRVLQYGVKVGRIITTVKASPGGEEATSGKLNVGGRQGWRFVYKHKLCGVCKGPVRRWSVSTRMVFACETCQPLPPSGPPELKIPTTTGKGRHRVPESEGFERQEKRMIRKENGGKTRRSGKRMDADEEAITEHQALEHITTGGLPDIETEFLAITPLSTGLPFTMQVSDRAMLGLPAIVGIDTQPIKPSPDPCDAVSSEVGWPCRSRKLF